MENVNIPCNQLLHCSITGKFEAPNAYWKHAKFDLLDYELIIMTEGTLYITYNEENYTAVPGEFLLLPPTSGFREGFREAYSAFYWLHFAVPSPATSSEEISLPIHGKLNKPEKAIVLMKQLQDMKKSNYPVFAVNAMTTTILMEVYGQLTAKADAEEKLSLQKQVYNDIIDYIDANIYSNLKVSDIASHFGYNEKYLSHRFNAISCFPLKQYILKTKMERASFLLSDTNESISEIAQRFHFTDSHNFSRTYKKLTGLSPSEYRNAYSKRLLFHT